MAGVDVPFEPKSNAHLEPGQFWAIPLSNGTFACGRVLAVSHTPDPSIPVNSRAFLAGLLGWVGDEPPTSDAIAGAPLIAQGFAHVLTIRRSGGLILGRRPLEVDGMAPRLWLARPFTDDAWVYRGAERLRAAEPSDASLPTIVAWGVRYIAELAERTFVAR